MDLTKKLLEGVQKVSREHSLDHVSAISDLLDYIIAFLNPINAPNPHWTHGEAVNRAFYDLMLTYFSGMSEELEHRDWYDAWGDLFMEAVKGVASYRGQFFTPSSVSDLCASLSKDTSGEERTRFGTRRVINDPTCGSSRMLLAGRNQALKETGKEPYLVGEDIDTMCVRMSAVNIAIHGGFGEVVCHDSLCSPGEIRFGYIINEGMWPCPGGLPTIRRSENANDFLCCSKWNARAKQMEEQKVVEEEEPNLFSGLGID